MTQDEEKGMEKAVETIVKSIIEADSGTQVALGTATLFSTIIEHANATKKREEELRSRIITLEGRLDYIITFLITNQTNEGK